MLRNPSPTLTASSLKPCPMAALPLQCLPFHPLPRLLAKPSRTNSPKKFGILRLIAVKASRQSSIVASNPEDEECSSEDSERPPFDLNLAVVLAGFAFEAYTSPSTNLGWRETDAADCQTVFLSEAFLREVYDGQLFVKLKKGVDLPAMDPWGTSDPYVILQLESQVAKSKVKWGTKEPVWNEDFTLNMKVARAKILQVAAWDANLVTPHKRMGNAGVKIESLCDGNAHEVEVELEGIGGGGRIYLEVKYKSYDEINAEKQWWRIPFITDFLMKSSLGSALRMALGSESINSRQFVESAFGQLKSFNYSYLQKLPSKTNNDKAEGSENSADSVDGLEKQTQPGRSQESCEFEANTEKEYIPPVFPDDSNKTGSLDKSITESSKADDYFWRAFTDIINQTVLQKFGFSLPEFIKWDGFELLNKMGAQSQKIAEEGYVESGLATPEAKNNDIDRKDVPSTINGNISSVLDIRRASQDILNQMETIFGALMVLTAVLSQQKNEPSEGDNVSTKDASTIKAEDVKGDSTNEIVGDFAEERLALEKQKAEEMKMLFSSAASAMEAWAMLATSLGHTSFIKSEFEKICFLDNIATDTQVAIWRDTLRRRVVVAFRGTEQAKWKDLLTDLMLIPTGLNPERLGGDIKQEVQVHSGFLTAYDSVRNRILTLIKFSTTSLPEDNPESMASWHIYVTGHSLGGALATLLALELSTSQMAKSGLISITMYNFGSPRVGNRRFAELYNGKVKDSWRVVNHRDIIPTVPRLMGYCHIAQPVYLAAGDLKEALEDMELAGDGYQVDVIGESTPDVLVSEFMKGEKQLVEKILQTEISLLRSIRDGTALMQHMEDFYYITLLESVRSNYRRDGSSNFSQENYPSAA